MLKPLMITSALLLSTSLAQAADAPLCDAEAMACPISLTGGPAASPVICNSDPYTVVYTVTNDGDFDIEFVAFLQSEAGDDSPTSTVTIDTDPDNSSCYETSPPSVPAEDSCTITVIIDPTNCAPGDFPEFIVRELVVLPSNQGPLTTPINVEVDGRPFLTILPGNYVPNPPFSTNFVENPIPFLSVHNADNIWKGFDGFTPFTTGSFLSGTCTPLGTSGICIAAGSDLQSPDPRTILYVSQDGGVSWHKQASPDSSVLPNGYFVSVACSNDDSPAAYCSAVGNNRLTSPVTAMYSVDSGENWHHYTGLPGLGALVDISCIDDAVGGYCIGAYQVPETNPFPPDTQLFRFNPNGTTGAITPLIILGAFYNATACTGSVSDKAVCIAVGYFGPVGGDFPRNESTMITMYRNPGNITSNWNITTDVGMLQAAACTTAVNGDVVCLGAGDRPDLDPPPNSESTLYMNIDTYDAPGSWFAVPDGFVDNTIFYAAACETNSTKTACIVAGKEVSGFDRTALYVNTDVMADPYNWNRVTTTSLTGSFEGAACTTTDSDQITCTVAGVSAFGAAAIMLTTPDILTTGWTSASISDFNPPNVSCYHSAGAGGASSGKEGQC